MTETYRVVEYSEHGDSSVLKVAERPVPAPGPGQVRITVRAASVNPIDWKIRSGKAFPATFPVIPGGDVAGVVDAVGDGVTEFAVGDEVLGSATGGGYAEVVLAAADALTAKPAKLSWEQAAAIPAVTKTAYRALALLNLEQGETLVIDGAAGGVGTVAIQLAVHRGLTVIGTASETNHEYLRSLGAIPVVYGNGLADRVRAAAPAGVDAALDASGRGSLPALIELTGGTERVITIAAPDAADHGVRFSGGDPSENVPGALADGTQLVADGKLQLPVAGTYPLAEAAAAQDESEAGHVRGKLILLP
ncbi:NADPH:quinone reductase [Amycolatopsis xylanica]|uniref:NADPH:quinone reductase n=1 Tax=Amycolatopsis xylanica TaxID=589385 RepID=A0A1H2T223_9PSEU|nr:NADP-dependent oxidoreductase [Amycolatopsis xylanica]SDW37339.1 NADPH:quinone reductase [Amycolatopsis xylanica]